jgi:hypothetical protein
MGKNEFGLIKDVIIEIQQKFNDKDITFLEKLAYVECLDIIKSELTGYDLSEFGLEEDQELKYGITKR